MHARNATNDRKNIAVVWIDVFGMVGLSYKIYFGLARDCAGSDRNPILDNKKRYYNLGIISKCSCWGNIICDKYAHQRKHRARGCLFVFNIWKLFMFCG